MKTIHLKCGHNIKVSVWPSQAGMKKVRHHYRVHHPSMMKKMTRKSISTKRKIGLINPFDLEAGINKLRLEYSKLSTFPISHHSKFRMILDKTDNETVKILANAKIKFVSVMARNEMFRRGLTNVRRNRCKNPISETRRLNCRLEADRLYREGKGVAHIWRYLKSKYHISQKDAMKFARQAATEAVWARSENPKKKWYVGSNKFTRKGEIFDSSFKPTKQSHGRFYSYVTGPFAIIGEAQKYKRDMDLV